MICYLGCCFGVLGWSDLLARCWFCGCVLWVSGIWCGGFCVDFVLNCFELDVLYSGCLHNVVFGLLLWFIVC